MLNGYKDILPGRSLAHSVRKSWVWMLVLGILMVVLGTSGLTMLFALTIASVLYFGVFLFVASGLQLLHLFRDTQLRSVFWHVVMAILYFVGGVMIFFNPLLVSTSLTFTLAVILIGIGVARIILAIQLRSIQAWGWMLLSGIISIMLGATILVEWPQVSSWLIGLIVAIELIFYGWASIMFSLALKVSPKLQQPGQQATA